MDTDFGRRVGASLRRALEIAASVAVVVIAFWLGLELAARAAAVSAQDAAPAPTPPVPDPVWSVVRKSDGVIVGNWRAPTAAAAVRKEADEDGQRWVYVADGYVPQPGDVSDGGNPPRWKRTVHRTSKPWGVAADFRAVRIPTSWRDRRGREEVPHPGNGKRWAHRGGRFLVEDRP